MDVSTLFAAPNTAASATALSFGVLAGNGSNAAAAGDGLEGLDSFNQLLGNFLSVTGGEKAGPVVATDGNAAPEVESTSVSPALPQEKAALTGAGLVKGIGVNATPGGQVLVGRSMEGRWAQSGLNLLAGGGLAGQEMNQEVISFLNDLSQAVTGQGEGTISTPQQITGEPVVESDATERLVVLQGEGTPMAASASASASAAAVNPPFLAGTNNGTQVIPKSDMTCTQGQLGITLTVAGTGLTSLPTVTVVEDAPPPVSPPVIPRALSTAHAVSRPPSGTAVPDSIPAMTAPSVPEVTAPIIPVMDSRILSDVDISATATPTDDDEKDGASALLATVAHVSVTEQAMQTQAVPAKILSTSLAAPVTPAPAIVPTVDIQAAAADAAVVTSATNQAVPVEASLAKAVAVPTEDATPTRTITATEITATEITATASAPMRVPSADDNARINGNISPTLTADDRPTPTQTVSAAASATNKSASSMVAAADPERPDHKVMTAMPLAAPIVDDPAPTLNVAAPSARSVDVSLRTATPTVADPVVLDERKDVPVAQNLTASAFVNGDASVVPDAPAAEQSAANAQMMEPQNDAAPASTISASKLGTAGSAPSRRMTGTVSAAPEDADRVATLSIPIELVTETATEGQTSPITAVAAMPVELKQASVTSAPIMPPTSTPDRTIGTQAVATAIPEAAPQSPVVAAMPDAAPQSPVVAAMPDAVTTNDTPVAAAAPVPVDGSSISVSMAVAQVAAPTDASAVRIVTESAIKAAAVKSRMPAAPSSATPEPTITDPLVSDPSLALTDAATSPAETGTPKTSTPTPNPARVTVAISRTTAPVILAPRSQLAPADQVGNGQAVGDDATEDLDATNQKMLAPKHMGEQSRLVEAQSELGNAAQSAGQNNATVRQDTGFARTTIAGVGG